MFTRLIPDLNTLIRLTPGDKHADLVAQINTIIRAAEVTLATRAGIRARGQSAGSEAPPEEVNS